MRAANDQPLHALFLILDNNDDDAGSELNRWLAEILPSCNWRSHLWLIPSNPASTPDTDQMSAVVSNHLERFQLCHLNLHPVITVGNDAANQSNSWARLLEVVKPLQEEAYREQGEARMVVAPVILGSHEAEARDITDALRFFNHRMAPPVLVQSSSTELANSALDLVRRVMVIDGEVTRAAVVEQLRAHHVFDSLLARDEAGPEKLLAPCRQHLVVDTTRHCQAACLWAWQHDLVVLFDAADSSRTLPPAVPAETCRRCMVRSMAALPAGLSAGRRRSEGRQTGLRLAMAMADLGHHHEAAELATVAEHLADQESERTAALVHRALCHLECGELAAADAALEKAVVHGADAAMVAYHRARVQVAWRDDIVALDHFATALDLGVESVSAAELHFEMALSHIRIEEFVDAAVHLAEATVPGREPEVAFLKGVCELNQGRPEDGLENFDLALRLGPEPDDLARVLLYRATCLKELERFTEAIATLQQARTADPEELAIINLLGFCHYSLGQHQEAVSCFEAAITIDPSSAIDWANLGSNLRDLGRTADAVAAYRKALELDPSITFARENLALLLEQD